MLHVFRSVFLALFIFLSPFTVGVTILYVVFMLFFWFFPTKFVCPTGTAGKHFHFVQYFRGMLNVFLFAGESDEETSNNIRKQIGECS